MGNSPHADHARELGNPPEAIAHPAAHLVGTMVVNERRTS
jgi:hypothetical protein